MGRRAVFPVFIGIVLVLAVPFALSSIVKGIDGLTGPAWFETRFFHPDAPMANLGIFAHMVAGGVITALALLQTLPQIRRRRPTWHRGMGRIVVIGAALTALGGLAYMTSQPTIGGPWMRFGFTLYGVLMALAAAQTWRFARAKAFERHRRWGLRLVWLAIGSWLYRVMYTLWVLSFGPLGIEADFTGPFDRVMVLAFFLPQLALLELYLRRRGAVEPAFPPR